MDSRGDSVHKFVLFITLIVLCSTALLHSAWHKTSTGKWLVKQSLELDNLSDFFPRFLFRLMALLIFLALTVTTVTTYCDVFLVCSITIFLWIIRFDKIVEQIQKSCFKVNNSSHTGKVPKHFTFPISAFLSLPWGTGQKPKEKRYLPECNDQCKLTDPNDNKFYVSQHSRLLTMHTVCEPADRDNT